jgi:hypothetical protein
MTLVGRRDEAAALAALIETVRHGRSRKRPQGEVS